MRISTRSTPPSTTSIENVEPGTVVRSERDELYVKLNGGNHRLNDRKGRSWAAHGTRLRDGRIMGFRSGEQVTVVDGEFTAEN